MTRWRTTRWRLLAVTVLCAASARAERPGGPDDGPGNGPEDDSVGQGEAAPESCPEGGSWHAEKEPERHAVNDLVPARVGWCELGGKRHGPMRLWWPSGALMREVYFERGVETGRLASFFPDGRPEVEARQRDGQVEGRFVLWHKSGQKAREMTYESGRPHGWATYWSEAGKLLSRGSWVDAKKEGVWETFHPNGVIKEVARWESGRLSGRQFLFNEGGRFVGGACWEEGERRWESKNEAETRTRRCRPW